MLVNNIAAVNTDARILLKNIFLIFGIKIRPFLLFDRRNFLFSMWHLEKSIRRILVTSVVS